MPYVAHFGSKRYILSVVFETTIEGLHILKGAYLYSLDGRAMGFLTVWNMSEEVKDGLRKYSKRQFPDFIELNQPDPSSTSTVHEPDVALSKLEVALKEKRFKRH